MGTPASASPHRFVRSYVVVLTQQFRVQTCIDLTCGLFLPHACARPVTKRLPERVLLDGSELVLKLRQGNDQLELRVILDGVQHGAEQSGASKCGLF